MAAFSIRLGAQLPNFDCKTTKGDFKFHEYLEKDEPWTILFSHPKDFTPVCTTELGMCHKLVPAFKDFGVKLIGVSCDPVDSHKGWEKDIMHREKVTGDGLDFPIIADEGKDIVTQLGMLDPLEKDNAGMPLPARGLIVIGANKEVKLYILYPATTGRNFEEVLRIVRSLKLTADMKLATPVNWKDGDRCIVAPPVPTEEAKEKYKNFMIEELPSGKPYLRTVDCPPK